MLFNHKQLLLGAVAVALPITSALSAPLPLDIRAGQRVVSYFPSQLELAEGMQPYCQKQKIDGDLCLFAYTATLTAKAMQRAGYSAKDTLALIANNRY